MVQDQMQKALQLLSAPNPNNDEIERAVSQVLSTAGVGAGVSQSNGNGAASSIGKKSVGTIKHDDATQKITLDTTDYDFDANSPAKASTTTRTTKSSAAAAASASAASVSGTGPDSHRKAELLQKNSIGNIQKNATQTVILDTTNYDVDDLDESQQQSPSNNNKNGANSTANSSTTKPFPKSSRTLNTAADADYEDDYGDDDDDDNNNNNTPSLDDSSTQKRKKYERRPTHVVEEEKKFKARYDDIPLGRQGAQMIKKKIKDQFIKQPAESKAEGLINTDVLLDDMSENERKDFFLCRASM